MNIGKDAKRIVGTSGGSDNYLTLLCPDLVKLINRDEFTFANVADASARDDFQVLYCDPAARFNQRLKSNQIVLPSAQWITGGLAGVNLGEIHNPARVCDLTILRIKDFQYSRLRAPCIEDKQTRRFVSQFAIGNSEYTNH
ncbi:MAG: hypothetical protein H7240_02565 [Glaciimonas sp.]|nr:hypothetical protein [Glaciimonas sp.]